jgi:hypothetical protein
MLLSRVCPWMVTSTDENWGYGSEVF